MNKACLHIVLVLIAGMALAGCSGNLDDAPYRDPGLGIEERVEDLLARMTLDEKLGQMTQANLGSVLDVRNVTRYKLGSVLSGGGESPALLDEYTNRARYERYYRTHVRSRAVSPHNNPAEWVAMYNIYQEAALKTRLGIPMIYGIDSVHGFNTAYGAVIFPHNIGLGATRNEVLVEQASRITALEMTAGGLDWTFGPCLAVSRDERWGRSYESFGEDPELVSLLGAAAVRGLQGTDLSARGAVLACIKHYVADGGTFMGLNEGDAELTEEQLREIHLAPYIAALEEGAGSVMVSFSSWNTLRMHQHRYLVTEVLKGELGFDGFVVSDWAGWAKLVGTPREQIRNCINAGIDMMMVPSEYVDFIDVLRGLVRSGEVPMERIDDAVTRILRVKFRLGLFDDPFASPSPEIVASFGSAEHRAVARQAVRESMVLLKNDGGLLPLPRTGRILVVGPRANDLGSQCGGWTMTWQGGVYRDLTVGTTIYQAIREACPDAEVIYHAQIPDDAYYDTAYSLETLGDTSVDVIVAVVGETAHAETQGDDQQLVLTDEDIALMNNAAALGIPVVTIMISGRPMLIADQLEQSDAFIAAWLPGTEGGGVADVLFGDYAPTGRLPMSWPRTLADVPINVGDGRVGLFPYGYGLTY